ncbi:MAG: glycoside hydrolase family 2 protein [Aggregatilineales bacterium]
MRLQRSLAGSWQFQVDPKGTIIPSTLAPDRQLTVPLPWQAAFPDLETYSGYAWYRHTIQLDETWLNGELLLKFGAVDYWCEVFVNGQRVGEHEGGYTPFTFPIRAYAHTGDNEIAVRVYDPAQTEITIPRWPDQIEPDESVKARFNAVDVPHGKQEWYLNVGGIWQDVTLTAVPSVYLDHVAVSADIHGGAVDIAVELSGGVPASGGQLVAVIDNKRVEVPVVAGQTHYSIQMQVKKPQLWSPDSPTLYTAAISLHNRSSKDADDTLNVRFGFREITIRDGNLLLNGTPLFLLGVLDQDVYPETIYTIPSDGYLRDEFQKARQLGINCLRCHIKPPDPRYLDLADEMGLLVWAEIPSWRTFYPRTTLHAGALELPATVKARVEQTLTEMIRRDYNHPSIIIWTLVNEDWGTILPFSPTDRAWLSALYDRCKQIDPTRLVVDNSACGSQWGPNIHVKSDLDDFHTYRNIPDYAADWVQFIEQFGLRPLWSYSNHGDSQRTGHEPLILSEFGNWGLPSLRSISPPDGSEPSWFALGPWWSMWSGEPGWPQGVAKRFKQLGLDAVWPDYEAFASATQWHQFAAMKFEIEAMRCQPTVVGYVITELTDAYWESNGLLDFNRCPKVYHDKFAMINAPDVLIPRVNRYAGWAGERLPIKIETSHYGTAKWANVTLGWQGSESDGERTFRRIKPAAVTALGTQSVTLPQVDTTQTVQMRFTLRGADGKIMAHNMLDALTLPDTARRAAYEGQVSVMVRETNNKRKLTSALQRLGYRAEQGLQPDSRLLVTNHPDAESLQWVRDGGDMLYLSQTVGPFFWLEGRGGSYGGNWITSFNWLRPGVYRRLTVDNPLTLPFASIAPTGVIVGLPMYDAAFQPDFLAGQVTGWVRHPALHTVQFRYGRGRVIMTTYALRTALEESSPDPVGVAMFHDLVDHLVSDACQPQLSANY